MLRSTRHPWNLSLLEPERIPTLAAAVQLYQDEPFGGLPTLGMACVHERARERGVTVLLDGNLGSTKPGAATTTTDTLKK